MRAKPEETEATEEEIQAKPEEAEATEAEMQAKPKKLKQWKEKVE
jgi:hypothetical protein